MIILLTLLSQFLEKKKLSKFILAYFHKITGLIQYAACKSYGYYNLKKKKKCQGQWANVWWE